MTIYTVALGKGGSAKTATAAELTAHLARAGRRVLALDLDQQGNLTTRLGVTADTEVDAVAAEVLLGDATAAEAAVPSPSVPGAHVIAGTHELASLDTKPEVIASLRDYLPSLGEWDDIVIDTPPAMSLPTLAALAAAQVVVASVVCSAEAYDQLDRLVSVLEQRIAPRLRPGAGVDWIVPARYDGRRVLDREVVDMLTERFPDHVTTPIREAVAVRDAYTAGQPVSTFAPKSPVSTDYAQAMTQVTGRTPR